MSIHSELQIAPTGVGTIVADLLSGGRQLRPAQVQMAILVQRATNERVHAILEAPTGTGKTAAYLSPLIRAGKTVIVSTANKALQDQIYFKDVPYLQQHQQPFGAVVMKGVGSYVCRDRLYEAGKELRISGSQPDLERLVDLVQTDHAFSGDFETLDFAVPVGLRLRVNGDRDECAWSKCDFFDRCFIRKMRDTALSAQIIIVNHTLLLLDALTEGAILPHSEEGDYSEVLVIDEAHHLATEATSVFTVSVRPTQFSSLLQLRAVKDYAPETLYNEIGILATHLWDRIEQTPFGTASKVPFREPISEAQALPERLADLVDALRKNRPANQTDKETTLYDKLLKRVQNLASGIKLVFGVETGGSYVHYLERVETKGQRSVSFQACAAPLDVAPFLKEKLFDQYESVVMASATLATVGPNMAHPEENGKPNFAYFRRQVGLSYDDFPKAIERLLPLTFDYKKNSLLYIPSYIPEPVYGEGPHVQRYNQAIADEMRDMVMASRGRAFLLFSSRRMLDEVYGRIAPSLPFPLLRQGDEMSRAEMTRRFREQEGSVLFGLKSFWEGVDIAGDALSLVVIDKLPFTTPDDPIQEELINQMKARGENWFALYILPEVVLKLKQGVGRLIRTSEDRGVIAILDRRLVTKGYGKGVLGALPPSQRTSQMADVKRFFGQE